MLSLLVNEQKSTLVPVYWGRARLDPSQGLPPRGLILDDIGSDIQDHDPPNNNSLGLPQATEAYGGMYLRAVLQALPNVSRVSLLPEHTPLGLSAHHLSSGPHLPGLVERPKISNDGGAFCFPSTVSTLSTCQT